MTITPGLDTALVLRSALTKGRWPAYATALGVCSGVLVWGMAAAVGISALLTASEVAYTVLRLVGAAYLVWLGLRLLVAAIRRDRVPEVPQFIPPDASPVLMGALLATVHSIEGILWFALMIAAAHAMRAWLSRRRVQRSLDGGTGAVLIGFGIALALPER